MTEHRIATLAMKVFAMYVAFQGLSGLARIVESLANEFDIDFLTFGGLFSSIFFILLAAAMWFGAERLAHRALPVGTDEPAESNGVDLTSRTVLSLAFVILGIYLLTSAVVSGIVAVAMWVELQGNLEPFDPDILGQQVRRSGYTAAGYLIAGLALLLGTRGLTTFLTRPWWTGGTEEAPRSEDAIEVEVHEPPDDT